MSGAKAGFSLKAIKPNIGGGRVSSADETLTSSYDLVEQLQFLFIRIVRARALPLITASDVCEPFVEVKIGNYKATTKYLETKPNLEWNQVFALIRDRMQSTSVEVTVRDKQILFHENLIGKVSTYLSDIPTRIPPDSAFAPQWYKLQDKNGGTVGTGEVMLSVWFGTQADEVFLDAWHMDTATVSGESLLNTRSKVYISPRLWYLRVNIIQAQDLEPSSRNRKPEVYVKATVGDVRLRTRVSPNKDLNPKWNEDLMFVTAEPFTDNLILSVVDKLGNNIEECIGKCVIRLSQVDQRPLPLPAGPKWYNLQRVVSEDGAKRELAFSSMLNARISLDGGYHVFDESVQYSSDFRPAAKKLWPGVIGVLELGIISASGLQPMKLRKGRETTDAYCVAKYGLKWFKTRTIVDSFDPKWNEQYTFEVYDPYTVLTLGVFEDSRLQGGDVLGAGKDPSMGKVRIRVSTLFSHKIYTYSYPLVVLQPNGVKQMGEIQLAVRFVCKTSYLNLFLAYVNNPLFPRMHYIFPLSILQLDSLRQQAARILCQQLSQAEPPLKKEVVENILDGGSQMWSLRKGKANFQRLLATLNWFLDAWKWFDGILRWKNFWHTLAALSIYCMAVFWPEFVMLWAGFLLFSYWSGVIIWRWITQPKHPPHLDVKLSLADSASADQLDEEFDTFPSSREADVLRMRYDRLRIIAGRFMAVIGDLASQAERFHSLLNWQDPRITSVFLVCCLLASLLLYFLLLPYPSFFRFCLVAVGVYVTVKKHPSLRVDIPNVFLNIISRLPTKADYML